MASYSIAMTKDHLSSLIDKAMAGEEVVITRHGKPVVELRVIPPPRLDREAALERVSALRESLPPMPATPLHRFSDWLYEDEEA